jgi:hypothetical protein
MKMGLIKKLSEINLHHLSEKLTGEAERIFDEEITSRYSQRSWNPFYWACPKTEIDGRKVDTPYIWHSSPSPYSYEGRIYDPSKEVVRGNIKKVLNDIRERGGEHDDLVIIGAGMALSDSSENIEEIIRRISLSLERWNRVISIVEKRGNPNIASWCFYNNVLGLYSNIVEVNSRRR